MQRFGSHILNRETNYTTFFTETGTILAETYDNFEFAVAQYQNATNNANLFNKSIDSNVQLSVYPNPFNPTASINYSVDNPSFVSIKIYDMLGRQIKTLVEENKTKGNYTTIFNSDNLASGVYFYRAIIGPKVYVNKLILQK